MRIFICTFKNYEYPSDDGYFPIQLGSSIADVKLNIDGDESGDSISHLNPYFSELTGLYWIWKNADCETVGLVHYRRYFAALIDKTVRVNNISVASSRDLLSLLDSADIIVAKPRNYYIESVKSHYNHSHYKNDLDVLFAVIEEMEPDYLSSAYKFFKGRHLSLFNMFFAKKVLSDEYCAWLFPILFELQRRIPYQNYNAYQARVFGFLAERLFNIWLDKNSDRIRIKMLPVVHIEGENLIKKAFGLLRRKFIVSHS